MGLSYQDRNKPILGFFCHSDIVTFKLTILENFVSFTIFVSFSFCLATCEIPLKNALI